MVFFWKIESFIFRFQLLWNNICMTNPIHGNDYQFRQKSILMPGITFWTIPYDMDMPYIIKRTMHECTGSFPYDVIQHWSLTIEDF
jgi:hypothetical protein